MSEVKSEGQHLYDLYTQKDLRRERDLWRAEALAARKCLDFKPTEEVGYLEAQNEYEDRQSTYDAARKKTEEAGLK